jgi:hypothetical protein
MMKDVRFGWLGETRRAALLSLLTSQVTDWAREWWIGAADGVVDVQPAERAAAHDKRNLPLLSTHEAGSLAIHLGAKDFDSIGRFLVGTTSDADFELAQRVGEEALTDLAARIQRRAGVNKANPLVREAAPLSLEHARLGAFGVTLSIGRLQFELVIDRPMADRLAPPTMAAGVNLVARHNAIQHAPLRVVAMMDFGSVDLAHLSDLSVGEVLVGDRKLDEALQIHLEGHGAIATGYLRRLGEQRAVMLDGVKPQEKSSHE